MDMAALALLLTQCRREGKYRRVEVCVKRKDAAAIHVYEKAGFRDTGYTDPDTPDSLCMAWNLPETWRGDVELRLTCEADLEHVQRLWATPSVMHYVGFPEGLHETMAHLREDWLPWVQQPPKRQHWSVYAEGVGYCGETYYNVDETGLACMDVKLLDCARGKGIGYRALSHALNAAFHVGGADRAYVDPHPENGKALALYAALGFLPAVRPSHLEPWDSTYFELTRENWEARMEFKSGNVVLRDMGEPTLRTKSAGTRWRPSGPSGTPLGRAWRRSNPLTRRPIAGQSWSS